MRRAKIVCTLGPSTSTPQKIQELVAAGMDLARLNLSHGDHAVHEANYRAVRAAGDAADERIPMLFGCCHPALAVEAQLALMLRAVVGLTTAQIARAHGAHLDRLREFLRRKPELRQLGIKVGSTVGFPPAAAERILSEFKGAGSC